MVLRVFLSVSPFTFLGARSFFHCLASPFHSFVTSLVRGAGPQSPPLLSHKGEQPIKV